MRYLVCLLIVLSHPFSFSQDTLIYYSGESEPVQIIAINTEENLIKYRIGGDTVVRTISSLSNYVLHSTEVSEVVLNPRIPAIREPVDNKSQLQKILYNWFTIRSKNKPSKFSFGFNTLSLLAGLQTTEFQVASNAHLSFYGEHQLKERLGLRITGKIGLTRPDFEKEVWDEDWDPSGGKVPINEMIFEIGFEPSYYINKHNLLSIYVKPGVYVGRNYAKEVTQYKDYYNAPPWMAPTYAEVHIKTRIGAAGWYHRISLSTGTEINVMKNLSFGFEIGTYFGNNIRKHRIDYHNTHTSESFVWEGDENLALDNQLLLQGAINIIYRFSSKNLIKNE